MHQDLQNRLFFLESRLQAAQSVKAASSTIGNLDQEKLARGFTRMEERLRYLEMGVHSQQYVSAASDPAGKLDAYESQEAIKAELNRIRESQGKK